MHAPFVPACCRCSMSRTVTKRCAPTSGQGKRRDRCAADTLITTHAHDHHVQPPTRRSGRPHLPRTSLMPSSPSRAPPRTRQRRSSRGLEDHHQRQSRRQGRGRDRAHRNHSPSARVQRPRPRALERRRPQRPAHGQVGRGAYGCSRRFVDKEQPDVLAISEHKLTQAKVADNEKKLLKLLPGYTAPGASAPPRTATRAWSRSCATRSRRRSRSTPSVRACTRAARSP